MSDVTEAVEQDAIAESLLGTPNEAEATVEAGTEAVEEVQQEEQTEELAQEEDADWLPDEQSKVFPDEVIAKYAQRFGYKPEDVEGNPSLKHLLHDKINSDILIQQLRQQQGAPVEEAPAPEPTQPQMSYEDVRKDISNFVRTQIDPTRASQFMTTLGQEKDPVKVATLLAEEACDWAQRIVDVRLQQVMGKMDYFLEQSLPGSTRALAEPMYASAWQSASQKAGVELPAYNTAEFNKLVSDVIAKVPGLDEMVREAEGTRGYMTAKDAQKLYGIVAAVAAGQKPNPQMMAQAVQKGQQLQRQSASRKQAGNLGAGKSNQETAPMQTNDDIFGEGMELYKQVHGRV